jgi:hypothetical protein
MDSSDDDAPLPKYLGDYPDGAYFAAETPPGADLHAQHRTPPRSVHHSDGMPVEPRKSIDLDADERALLASGLMEWFGPLEVTEALAVALGFHGVEDMFVEGERIERAIGTGEPLTARDWSRAVAAVGFAFVVEADEWTSIRGGTDAHWIGILRRVQRKVPLSLRLLGQ